MTVGPRTTILAPARRVIDDGDLTLYHGDALETLRQLPDGSVHMCVTSPPFYGLRDYGTGTWEGGDESCNHVKTQMRHVNLAQSVHSTRGGAKKAATVADIPYGAECGKCGARRIDQQIGLENSPDEWVRSLVAVFREVRRVLRNDGTCWIEVGDSYAQYDGQGNLDEPREPGLHGAFRVSSRLSEVAEARHSRHSLPNGFKRKDLVGAPWLLAFALRADGWYLRSDIIWARPNPMPESVTDRPTKSHSYLFLLSKQARYFYDADAIREAHAEPWRNGTSENRRMAKGGDGISREGWDYDVRLYNPAGRNKRSVWTIPTEPLPDEHYAAYPQALVEPCILAGTSERGVCPECGAPWLRETERELHPVQRTFTPTRPNDGFNKVMACHVPAKQSVTTTGWRPSCSCASSRGEVAHERDVVPSTVLDPFLGSGTTALVARRLGRRCVGIELSAKYCELAARRTQQLSLLA